MKSKRRDDESYLKKHDIERLNEAFRGFVADNATVTLEKSYQRYEDVCDRHGDTHWLAWPMFVATLRGIPYIEFGPDADECSVPDNFKIKFLSDPSKRREWKHAGVCEFDTYECAETWACRFFSISVKWRVVNTSESYAIEVFVPWALEPTEGRFDPTRDPHPEDM